MRDLGYLNIGRGLDLRLMRVVGGCNYVVHIWRGSGWNGILGNRDGELAKRVGDGVTQ